MAEWIPIEGGAFVAADVIRWKENVYAPKRSRKARPPRLGDRLVTAEVLQGPDADGWVRLLVRHCEILTELSVRKPPHVTRNTEIKRAVRTIMRGNPERLAWSDESARAAVVSTFLKRRRWKPP